jgi:phosphoglycerate kinase
MGIYMSFQFYTIDDFNFENKTVLLRVDINSPVDPISGLILDDMRMRLHAETISELSLKGARTVLLAHQSRPGKKDFTTLNEHSKMLSKILNRDVKYVEDIFGLTAREEISKMSKGDILILENVRFYSEEVMKMSPEQQSETHLVMKLAPLADYFINDAFAAAHRSQPSLVGFALKLPSAAGRIMERELKSLYNAIENIKRPCIYVLGGIKADDSLMVIENVLKRNNADYILTTGLIANIFLLASGIKIGKCNKEFIVNRGYNKCVKKAKNLLKMFNEKIKVPKDISVCIDDKRKEFPIKKIPNNPIYDIGRDTITEYAKFIRHAETIFANGPAGVFEKEEFSIGTEDILNSIASSNGFSIIGGGHLAAATKHMGISSAINHISSGGGACISLLGGKELPAVEVLKKDASKK